MKFSISITVDGSKRASKTWRAIEWRRPMPFLPWGSMHHEWRDPYQEHSDEQAQDPARRKEGRFCLTICENRLPQSSHKTLLKVWMPELITENLLKSHVFAQKSKLLTSLGSGYGYVFEYTFFTSEFRLWSFSRRLISRKRRSWSRWLWNRSRRRSRLWREDRGNRRAESFSR